MQVSDNASGADNQQERLSVETIPISLGNFLSGFALGEASFMLVCRPRGDYSRKWKISAAFNVSQHDITPLELFRETLNCGTIRKAGNDGWYFEVNRLSEIRNVVIPFFTRFPVVGKKAQDFELFKRAVEILSQEVMSNSDYANVLSLREAMNNGGKRKYSMERILRDYTPNSSLEEMIQSDLTGDCESWSEMTSRSSSARVVTTMNGPKVKVAASPVGNNRVNIWLYAGKPEYPALPKGDNATGADDQQERPRKRNPQRPHARHPTWMKIWSHLHGDMQG